MEPLTIGIYEQLYQRRRQALINQAVKAVVPTCMFDGPISRTMLEVVTQVWAADVRAEFRRLEAENG